MSDTRFDRLPAGGARRPAPTLRETVEGIGADLARAGIESPRLEAERLVSHVLGIDRAQLALTSARSFPPDRGRELANAVGRRIEGEPLQHIEGVVAFRDLLLVADSRALVPRPETEQLVDLVAAWADARAAGSGVRVVTGVRRPRPPVRTALDIGTGSGAIALSLASENIAAEILAIDRSRAALAQAAENAARTGAGDRVRFRHIGGDMWDAVGVFDLIVSNPPYIPDDEIAGLSRDVRKHDPIMALAGGVDGLDIVRSILSGAADHLHPGGGLFLELASDQAEVVAGLLSDDWWRDVAIRRDLAGLERFVSAVRR